MAWLASSEGVEPAWRAAPTARSSRESVPPPGWLKVLEVCFRERSRIWHRACVDRALAALQGGLLVLLQRQSRRRKDGISAAGSDGVRPCSGGSRRARRVVRGRRALEYEGLRRPSRALQGNLFRSLTTHGLTLLHESMVDDLVRARPDKVHFSIHFSDRETEVRRVIAQVAALRARGVRSGVNLLVPRSKLAEAKEAAIRLHESGIESDRRAHHPLGKHSRRSPGACGERDSDFLEAPTRRPPS